MFTEVTAPADHSVLGIREQRNVMGRPGLVLDIRPPGHDRMNLFFPQPPDPTSIDVGQKSLLRVQVNILTPGSNTGSTLIRSVSRAKKVVGTPLRQPPSKLTVAPGGVDRNVFPALSVA